MALSWALAAAEQGLRAQTSASVWDGVYMDDQAGRGGTLYNQNCASCHGERLKGKTPTPSLAGDTFKGNWNGQTVDDLFEKIQTSMPADKPGQLSRTQNADILAYILKFNEFPAGQHELPTEAAKLKQIRFETERPGK
jgi:mono/diheme cytochrome c family protein